MKRALALGLLFGLLSGVASPRDRMWGRFYDRATGAFGVHTEDSTPAAPTPPAFLFASELDSFASECACESSPLAADTGQSVPFIRSGAAWCTKSDYTVVKCSDSNKARVTKLLDPDGYFGVMMERGSTNDVLYSNDLSQAAVWAQVTTTLAKDATGPDGVANSASSATATAPGAVFWQTVTASGNRSTSFYMRRKSGDGKVSFTREGGAGWHEIQEDLTAVWKRWQPQPCGDILNCVEASWLKSTFTNPVLGVELQQSGDSIEMAFVMDEPLAWASSVIETGAGAVARNGEDLTLADPAGNYTTVSMFARSAPFVLGSQNVHPFSLRTAGAFFEARTVNGDGSIGVDTAFPGSTMVGTSPVVWASNVPNTYAGFAFSWGGSSGYVCNDSTCNATTGSVTMPATMTGFAIGRNQFLANNHIQGVVNKLCLDTDALKCLTWAGVTP